MKILENEASFTYNFCESWARWRYPPSQPHLLSPQLWLGQEGVAFSRSTKEREREGCLAPQERKLYTNRFTVTYIHTSILEGNSCTGPQLLQTLQDGTREFTAPLSIILLEDAEAKQATGTQK